ncbi:MAG: hypothetical protein M3Q06_11735, partial [Bacteroidota bacterium]|nr:hypothetical protein [Bacteroidota bacterium]
AEYNEALRRQKATLESGLLQYGKAQKQLQYYEQHALRQARLLREQASLKLSGGDISHIEWILLVNQAVQIEADYISALQEWNHTVIDLAAYANF